MSYLNPIFFFLFSLLISGFAKADILFIDFNLSEKEIGAAESAANIRGEKLVVFPEVSAEIRKYIDDVEVYKERITQNIKKCGKDNACAMKNINLYSKALADQEAVLAKIPFDIKVLTQFFEQMDREGRTFTAFIESGHAGAARFSGFFTAISHADLAAAVEGKSSLKTVKTALYWGCYTMSIGAVKNRWPKTFPNAHLIAGYDQVGPSGERVESSALLMQILIKENEAIATGNDLSALKVFFRNIQYSQTTNFAISIDYNTYVSNHNSLMMADAGKICSSDAYLPHAAIIRCYAEATTAGCENPPADTSNGAIRKSYTVIQGMDHCFDADSDLLSPVDRIDPDVTLRLMFFDFVKVNYAKFHKNDLLHFDSALLDAGVPTSLFLSELDKHSRAEIVKRVKALVELSPKLSPKLQMAIKEIRYSLVDLNTRSIPQSWIEKDPREGIPTDADRFSM